MIAYTDAGAESTPRPAVPRAAPGVELKWQLDFFES